MDSDRQPAVARHLTGNLGVSMPEFSHEVEEAQDVRQAVQCFRGCLPLQNPVPPAPDELRMACLDSRVLQLPVFSSCKYELVA